MTDILEKLRARMRQERPESDDGWYDEMRDAADEIERVRRFMKGKR